MSWELDFEVKDVSYEDLKQWLDSTGKGRCSKGWGGVQIDVITGLNDAFMGDAFYSFLDAIEKQFPSIRYEASYQEITRVTDSILCDVTVSFANGRRSVTDNSEEAQGELEEEIAEYGLGEYVGLGVYDGRVDLWNDEQNVSVMDSIEEAIDYIEDYCESYEDYPLVEEALEDADPRKVMLIWWLLEADEYGDLEKKLKNVTGDLSEVATLATELGMTEVAAQILEEAASR